MRPPPRFARNVNVRMGDDEREAVEAVSRLKSWPSARVVREAVRTYCAAQLGAKPAPKPETAAVVVPGATAPNTTRVKRTKPART
jgi:hypothetical protein